MAQAVERAIEILDVCSHEPTDIGSIAKHLGVHRSTASRLISTLESHGLLQRTANSTYRIGPRIYALWLRTADNNDLHATVRPHLQKLADVTGFSVHCAIPMQNRIISLDFIEPPYSIRLPLKRGTDVVVNTAGVAKAVLAFMPSAKRSEVLQNVEWIQYTERTIVDKDSFEGVLTKVRERGWAYDDGEFEDFSNCIAAPFFNARGEVGGAISLTTLKAQTPLTKLRDYVPQLLESMNELSRDLGYAP